MLISDLSVKHPVLAIVLSLLLVAFGFIALERLALREYPDVDPPVVSVETAYSGAASKTVENRITKVLEKQISGIAGIRYIESKSIDGLSTITIEFNTQRNIDAAANDVRERVSRAVSSLPSGANPPEIFKVDSNNNVIMWLNLTSDRMNALQLTDYAERHLIDKLSVIDGVARVRIGGAKRYAMRIWLNRKAMAARNVTVSDIEKALAQNNLELPAGRIESQQREFPIWVARNFNTQQDFSNLVIRRESNGHLLRLGEVAQVSLGPENHRTELRGNRINMVGLGVVKQSRANTLSVAKLVQAEISRLQSTLPKGMQIVQSYDTSVFIDAAIKEVYKTFAIALVLVVLVIFLFLGNLRSIFIPFVTIPISLIATFIILYAMDYSLNLLTLLALVLAIGLVVDDAIVVLENINRRIGLGEHPLLASYHGTRQVGFAVVATTLVLLAVFLPIALLEGSVGRLFTEFAFTISAAVIFSTIVALTLSPVMCSFILKSSMQHKTMTHYLDLTLARVNAVYRSLLLQCLKHGQWLIVGLLVIAAAGVWLFHRLPQELIPEEDRGAFFVIVKGPEGASFSYMQNYMRKVEDVMMRWVDYGLADRALSIMPNGFGSSDPVNSGIGIVVMKDWSKRNLSTQQTMMRSFLALKDLPGVRAIPVMRQGLGNHGAQQPVQFVIGNSSYEQLARWRDVIVAAAEQNPYLQNIDSDYQPTKIQLVVEVNRDRAAELGVSVEEVGRTLETMLGARDVTTFINKDEEYDVILESKLSQKATLKDLNNIYVRSSTTQELVPIGNVASISETTVANALNRFNRIKTITITANLAKGYSLGQALTFLENVVKKNLPNVVSVDYKGPSRDYKDARDAIYFTFGLALVIMLLVLAAQFGSFIHPLVIFMTAPLAITGALLGLTIAHDTLNIYSEIGLIMLIGLAAKNGILMIEFINQLREQGKSFHEAIIEGCLIRLRPILMTAISTIVGAVPLILATGAGANGRFSIGIVIVFGVTFATFFTLFILPVVYAKLARRTKARNARGQQLESLIRNQAG